MEDEHARLKAELAKLEQAIAAQEGLRGVVPDEQLEMVLDALMDKQAAVLAQLHGSGAIAQGDKAKAAGERGVAADTVRAPVITGNGSRAVQAQTYIERLEVPAGATEAPTQEALEHYLRSSYLNHIFETVGRLSLSGIDPKAASDAEALLELNAVYTALLTLTPEEREGGAGIDYPERVSRELRCLSALAQLDRHPRLVLLGDPGSGKSTFVNFVALCLAGEVLGRREANLGRLTEPLPRNEDSPQSEEELELQPWSHGALLPVRVVLRDFAARGLPPAPQLARASHLCAFIAAELVASRLGDFVPHLERELHEQGGLLLLDGLDEVPEAERRRVQIKDSVIDFAAAFPNCRILVTSRTYAYQQQAWRLPGFGETVLAPFGLGQIRRFVDRWYAYIAQPRHMHPDDARQRAGVLKKAIEASERLRELAERPLLLTLMASLHAWRGGSLPEKREELYADTVELLLDWWESPKVVGGVQQPSLAEWLKVDRQKVRKLLDELAYRAHAAQSSLAGTADLAEGDLLSGLMHMSRNLAVNPAQLVEYLSQRAGLLLPHGIGVYTFPHRTLQEYLAACYLTDHEYPDQVAELARRDPNRWREVVLLAGAKAARGTASAIWSMADALCFRDLEPGQEQEQADAWGALLGGQALAESADLNRASERNRPKVDRVRGHLVRLLESGRLPAVERAAAGNTLARLGDPREEAMTLGGMAFCLVPAGPFQMGGGREEHRNETLRYDFWMSHYPVTVAQFQGFVDAGGYKEGCYWREAEAAGVWQTGGVKGDVDDDLRNRPADFGEPLNLPNHPVVGVTWYEALAFTRWLTEQWRAARWIGPGQAVRLPSEAEWEKAARGGGQIPEQPLFGRAKDRLPADGLVIRLVRNPEPTRLCPWGGDADPSWANSLETAVGAMSAVGCFPGGASPYGCGDMAGNVWEWCHSLCEPYPYRPDDGREDPSAAGHRVLRGGSFSIPALYLCCWERLRVRPVSRGSDLGFRVVVSPA